MNQDNQSREEFKDANSVGSQAAQSNVANQSLGYDTQKGAVLTSNAALSGTRQNQPKQKYLNFNIPGNANQSQQFNTVEKREPGQGRPSKLEKIEEESDYEDTSINWAQRRRIFILFILGNLFLNYDNGVIPACLLQIEKDLKLGYQEMALMGSLVYFGLSVSSLFVSVIFQKFPATWVLGLNMIANAAACFLFSVSSNMWILYSMRFMLGFTQAFCVIYGPVWVNEFSPRQSNTKWMAILHSFVVIGVMAGYILGAITVTVFDKYLSWRFAFMLQGWFMILIGICFICADNQALDIFKLIKVQRPKSMSDAQREFAQAPESSSGQHTPSQGNYPQRSNYDGRSSINLDHKKSVRIDVISLNKNEFQIFAQQFKVTS